MKHKPLTAAAWITLRMIRAALHFRMHSTDSAPFFSDFYGKEVERAINSLMDEFGVMEVFDAIDSLLQEGPSL